MPLTISDEVLQQAGMGERDALIEFACHLFDSGKWTFPQAGRFAGLSRGEMEDELLDRGIPLYRPTREDYQQDIATLKKLKEQAAD